MRADKFAIKVCLSHERPNYAGMGIRYRLLTLYSREDNSLRSEDMADNICAFASMLFQVTYYLTAPCDGDVWSVADVDQTPPPCV